MALEKYRETMTEEVLHSWAKDAQEKMDELTTITEKYNFERKDNSWFQHLLLGGDVKELIGQPDFDSSNLQVDLKINGYQVALKDFNEVLGEWSDRIEKQVKEKYNYLESERAVIDKAEQLLKERCGAAINILENLKDIDLEDY